ncbi:MAG: TRAP transporter small permease [Oscillospiraceae bacterium]|nr:TRAP transporter small permease [Oscillospiraceae bacterium]
MLKKIIDNFEEIVCLIALSVMTILTFSNVVTRYVFNFSMNFAEEISTYSFVLLSLFGASIAAKRGAHLGFTLLADHVPKIVARVFEAISALAGIVFSGVIFYYGIRMTVTQFQRGQLSLGVQIPEWIYGSFVPLGAFFLLLRFVELLVQALRNREAVREDVLADALADALNDVPEEEREKFEKGE